MGQRITRDGTVATFVAAITVVAYLLPSARADSACWRYRDPERALARLANGARGKRGVSRLRLDPELSRVARKHTKEMVAAGVLKHSSYDQLSRRVTNWRALGENVGMGLRARRVHRAFMGSTAHRANILDRRFVHVGVGTLRDGRGRLWATVVFESSADPGTTLSMPSCG
ncbi:MAG: CAP domain-containing protein [Actinomycetota bacterium]